ncbi:hypothetical protein [Allocoleopsis sp.]|uniref:hypothetical protein n=1 Tax=Allocoleopsis sp. TaxID=3088169 RepID=UPI002FD665E3
MKSQNMNGFGRSLSKGLVQSSTRMRISSLGILSRYSRSNDYPRSVQGKKDEKRTVRNYSKAVNFSK